MEGKDIRPSCALLYQLYADGKLANEKNGLWMEFSVKNEIFGQKSAGSAFNVDFPCRIANRNGSFERGGSRTYIVAAEVILENYCLYHYLKKLYTIDVDTGKGSFRDPSIGRA